MKLRHEITYDAPLSDSDAEESAVEARGEPSTTTSA